LALAEMFKTHDYFGSTSTNNSRASHSGGDTHPSKRRRLATPDPGPPLQDPPPQPTPDLNIGSPRESLIINPGEVLANRWTGHDNISDSDDDVEFEGYTIPQLVGVSDDEGEESESDLEDQWDDGTFEDLLEVLETNVELDTSSAGV